MFFKYFPQREVDIPGYLGDIESHLPKGHPYKARDKMTWAHEGTHGINSQIRNENTEKVGSAYILNNTAWTAPQIQSVTLENVAKNVPDDIKGNIYNLYLISGQRWWNDSPLYLVDELSAYLNATRVGKEVGSLERDVKYSCTCTIEMFGYAGILLGMLEGEQKTELSALLISVNIEIKTLLFTYDTLRTQYTKLFDYIRLHQIVGE